MRKVNRSSVPFPERLSRLTNDNLSHLSDHNKISGAIYAHSDVKRSLKLLYFDKCYICEGDVSDGDYDVEHYLPKKLFPHLGYTWSNLHKSCSGCNLAKEKKDFFIKDSDGNIIDINLLDPASESYDISEYISFDINSKAELSKQGSDSEVIKKAQNTILYLNGEYDSVYGKGLSYARSNKAMFFLRFCVNNLLEYKGRLNEIKRSIGDYSMPNEIEIREIDQNICQSLINADNQYLSDEAPFSTSTRVQLFPILGITYRELVQIKVCMKKELGM